MTAEDTIDGVRRIHRRLATARLAGERQATAELLDRLARAETALTIDERDALWLAAGRGELEPTEPQPDEAPRHRAGRQVRERLAEYQPKETE